MKKGENRPEARRLGREMRGMWDRDLIEERVGAPNGAPRPRAKRPRGRFPAARSALVALIAPVAVLAVSIGLGFGPAERSPLQPVNAQEPEQGAGAMVDLVVDFGDGQVRVDRRDFRDGMTGGDLLAEADLELTTSGAAVCAIDGVGCPASDCFCACHQRDDCRVWSYHHLRPDGTWEYAQVAAADHRLAPGAVEGWVWVRPEPITSTLPLRSALAGMHWIQRFQAADGGVAENLGFSIEAVFGARSLGLDLDPGLAAPGLRAGPEADSVLDYLRAQAPTYADLGPAQAGKALAGLAAAGLDPHSLDGEDLVARLDRHYDPATGRYGSSTWDQAWAMLGRVAAGAAPPPEARAALIAMRSADGGWGFGAGEERADVDSTGLALQSLIAAGEPVDGTVVRGALDLLAGLGREAGGWGGEDGALNLNSTALALQGYWAAGVKPAEPLALAAVGQVTRTQQADGRFQFGDQPSDLTDLVASLQVLSALAGRSLALPGPAVAMRRGADWLQAQQQADGGFGGFGPGSSIDAVLALRAAGRDPDRAHESGARPSNYLAAVAEEYAASGASATGKLTVGVVALGQDPRAFGPAGAEIDLVARLLDAEDPASGAFGAGGTWDQSWAMLGLAAAGEVVSPAAVAYLRRAASPRGGWGFEARADAADADSTGLALQALVAAGRPASDYYAWLGANTLRELQLEDGGWGFGAMSSASSTALAIGGLSALGHAVDGAGWMRGAPGALARHGPRDSILGARSESGAFAGFGGPEDLSATSAAILGLSRQALPLEPWTEPQRPAPDPRLYLPRLGSED